MKAKEYLNQLGKLDDKIENRMAQIARIKSDYGLKAIDYSGIRVQTSLPSESIQIRKSEEVVDLEAELKKDLAKYHSLRYKIIKEIEQLSDGRHRKILKKRYIDRQSLADIAVEMGYSYDWVRHMHGIALLEFGRMM